MLAEAFNTWFQATNTADDQLYLDASFACSIKFFDHFDVGQVVEFQAD